LKRTISFNDKELEVDSLKTTIKPLFGISNTLVSRSNSISRRIGSFEVNAKMITLYFAIQHKSNYETIENIGDFFYTSGLSRLINPRDDRRYFLAKTEGEIDYIEDGNVVYCTVNLIAPEGLSRSVETKEFKFLTTTEGTIASVQNNGTYQTPIDIDVTFTSDANSIGFVSPDRIVQLGTSISEDADPVSPTEKVMNDAMGSASRNLWSQNTGRPRWRFDDGDHTSKVEGSLTWGSEEVYPASYGTWDKETTAGYWHGPTVTRLFTEPLSDFEVFHRLEFKPTGNAKQKPTCQGLIEINYSDADNNFIVGFEMKDNTNVADAVTFSFFVGDYRIYEANLPKSVINYNGGFFGSIMMKKIGNEFTFKLARINGSTWKETWSETKSWFNENVAMLSASVINCYMAQWRDFRPMNARLTHTRITKYNTESETIIPKVFYEGDILKVDGETNRVYINGIRDDSYRVVGSSQFLLAEKGDNEIIAISDGTFDGGLTIRERYL